MSRHRAPRPASWPRRLGAGALVGALAMSMVFVLTVEVAPATSATASQLQPTPGLAATPTLTRSPIPSPVTTTPVVAPQVSVIPLPTTAPPPTTTAPPTTTTKPPVTSLSPSQPRPAPATGTACEASGFGGVKPHVARVGYHLVARFGLRVAGIIGVAGRANVSDHPLGLALDLMVGSDKELGDGIADYVLERRALFAVHYVIWRQRINFGNGWEPMEDRGGITANHYDHVHVSFEPSGSNGLITC